MLVNGMVDWNMFTDVAGIIQENMNNADWSVYVVELILNWVHPIKNVLILTVKSIVVIITLLLQ